MANLIPDVGNVRPDTVGAGRLYQAAMEGFQRALNAPMERIEKLQAKQLEEDNYDIDNKCAVMVIVGSVFIFLGGIFAFLSASDTVLWVYNPQAWALSYIFGKL